MDATAQEVKLGALLALSLEASRPKTMYRLVYDPRDRMKDCESRLVTLADDHGYMIRVSGQKVQSQVVD